MQIEKNVINLRVWLVEREGFEPSIGLTLHTRSRRATSAAHPSLQRNFCF